MDGTRTTALKSPAVNGTGMIAVALRESLTAGLISLGMFFLIIGFKTEQNIRNELLVSARWETLAAAVAVVMFGRFAFAAFVWPTIDRRRSNSDRQALENRSVVEARLMRFAIVGLFLFPVLVVYLYGLQGSLKWIDNFGIQILIYVMLAWGLNIVIGLAGLLDLGYVAFYAVGAYTYALLAKEFGLPFWLLLPAAGAMAGLWGVLLGFPVLRLRGDYLAIVTLAFGEIIRLVLINWREFTNGSAGIASIPKVGLPFLSFDVSSPTYVGKLLELPPSPAYYKIFLYYLILILALMTAWVTIRLRRMPIGRAWEALREDEIACQSLGINTTNTKLTAFAIGAMFAGFAGSFFAARQGFISPESFTFLQSAIVLAIVVLGGMGSLIGIAIAATVMIGGMELLREMQFLKLLLGPDFTPELYRMLVFGLAMVVIMVWRPRGLVGSREPTDFLRDTKKVAVAFTREGRG